MLKELAVKDAQVNGNGNTERAVEYARSISNQREFVIFCRETNISKDRCIELIHESGFKKISAHAQWELTENWNYS